MSAYILRRLLLMIPTLFGIILLNFLIVQVTPGGPVEQVLAKLQGLNVSATARFTGGGGQDFSLDNSAQNRLAGGGVSSSKYRGSQGLDPEFIKELEMHSKAHDIGDLKNPTIKVTYEGAVWDIEKDNIYRSLDGVLLIDADENFYKNRYVSGKKKAYFKTG